VALFSKSITGLLNGVSRQPFTMRLESQGEEQINCLSSVSKGVVRRPGMQIMAKISVSPSTSDAWHWIDRSPTQRYLVRVATNSTTMGVTDLIAGTSVVVTGNAYTTASPAATYLRFLTIGDVTYICNTAVQPKFKINTTSGTYTSPVRAIWGLIWVKAAIPSTVYTASMCITGGSPAPATYTSSSAGADCTTAKIATGLAAAIVAQTVYEAESFGSIILVSYTSDAQTNASLFTMSTSDGWGDQALVALVNGGKVQSFSTLPPSAAHGMTVEVDGDQETAVDSYWVKYVVGNSGTAAQPSVGTYGGVTRAFGTGVWEETVKPTLPTAVTPTVAANTLVSTVIDNTTMPQTLTWDGTSWTLAAVTWGERTVGDNLTAPKPDFLSDYVASLPSTAPKITDMAFYKNRFVLISGESVSFSAVNDYTSFFPTTVVSVADDDAFDVVANFPDVAKLKYAVPFQELLVLFAESGIFGIEADNSAGLTPKSVKFTRLSNFTGTASTRPVAAGDRIFFTEDLNTRHVVREFVKNNQADAYVVETISEHVYDYLDSSALRSLTADGATQMLIASGINWAPKTWVYQWFSSNAEKVQSAWHTWSLNGDYAASSATLCLSLACRIIKGDVYTVVWVPRAGNGSVCVVKCPIDPPDLSGTTVSNGRISTLYVDYWTTVTGTTSGADAVFTCNQPINALAATASTDIFAIRTGVWWSGALCGTEATGGVVANPTDETMTLTFTGGAAAMSGKDLMIGVRYRSYYDFTPPVKKNQNGTPELSGRYFARRWRARFSEPVSVVCHQTVGPSTTGNQTHAKTMTVTSKKVVEFPIHREIDSTLNTGFYTEAATTGFELWGVDWDIEWSPRTRSL
jgi:hypothetical protein